MDCRGKGTFVGHERLRDRKGLTRLVCFAMIDQRHRATLGRTARSRSVSYTSERRRRSKRPSAWRTCRRLTAPGSEITIDVRGLRHARPWSASVYGAKDVGGSSRPAGALYGASAGPAEYTKDHEWIRIATSCEIGITITRSSNSATWSMSVARVGRTVTAGESFGSIESVKAVSGSCR